MSSNVQAILSFSSLCPVTEPSPVVIRTLSLLRVEHGRENIDMHIRDVAVHDTQNSSGRVVEGCDTAGCLRFLTLNEHT